MKERRSSSLFVTVLTACLLGASSLLAGCLAQPGDETDETSVSSSALDVARTEELAQPPAITQPAKGPAGTNVESDPQPDPWTGTLNDTAHDPQPDPWQPKTLKTR
jgi:hypothetical protein